MHIFPEIGEQRFFNLCSHSKNNMPALLDPFLGLLECRTTSSDYNEGGALFIIIFKDSAHRLETANNDGLLTSGWMHFNTKMKQEIWQMVSQLVTNLHWCKHCMRLAVLWTSSLSVLYLKQYFFKIFSDCNVLKIILNPWLRSVGCFENICYYIDIYSKSIIAED